MLFSHCGPFRCIGLMSYVSTYFKCRNDGIIVFSIIFVFWLRHALFNPFHGIGLFLYSLKILENQRKEKEKETSAMK